jgi:hypothetical protein
MPKRERDLEVLGQLIFRVDARTGTGRQGAAEARRPHVQQGVDAQQRSHARKAPGDSPGPAGKPHAAAKFVPLQLREHAALVGTSVVNGPHGRHAELANLAQLLQRSFNEARVEDGVGVHHQDAVSPLQLGQEALEGLVDGARLQGSVAFGLENLRQRARYAGRVVGAVISYDDDAPGHVGLLMQAQ